jgi:hypothetical protein
MSGLFRSIINIFNPKKQIAQKQDEGSKVYLDRGKNTFLLIKLLTTDTCQDIHINYHNEILGELMKNNQNSGGSFSKIINSNEFSFFIIDDENPFLELKLKMKDTPSKFMKKKSINLFYLEVSLNKKEEFSLEKIVSDDNLINGTPIQRSQSV